MVAEQPSRVDTHADDLRRRLYRPDATDADLERYLHEHHVRLEPVDLSERPRAKRPNRTALVAAVAAAALVAIVVAPKPATWTAEPTPAPEPVAQVEDVGDGQSLAIDGTVSGPSNQWAFIHGDAVLGQRFTGTGNAVVAITAPADALQGGRASIRLTSDGWSSPAWRALLPVTRADASTLQVALARGVAASTFGPAQPSVFVYPAAPPTRIAVAAPGGVRWTLVVALTDGFGPDS